MSNTFEVSQTEYSQDENLHSGSVCSLRKKIKSVHRSSSEPRHTIFLSENNKNLEKVSCFKKDLLGHTQRTELLHNQFTQLQENVISNTKQHHSGKKIAFCHHDYLKYNLPILTTVETTPLPHEADTAFTTPIRHVSTIKTRSRFKKGKKRDFIYQTMNVNQDKKTYSTSLRTRLLRDKPIHKKRTYLQLNQPVGQNEFKHDKLVSDTNEKDSLINDIPMHLNNLSQIEIVQKLNLSFNFLSFFSIYRRLEQRLQGNHFSNNQKNRLSSSTIGCLYHKSSTVPFPPGALPEHSLVWAKCVHDMPVQPTKVMGTAPWHLAKIVYVKPIPGYHLAFVHHQGNKESISNYLMEWAIGLPQSRVSDQRSVRSKAIDNQEGQPSISKGSDMRLREHVLIEDTLSGGGDTVDDSNGIRIQHTYNHDEHGISPTGTETVPLCNKNIYSSTIHTPVLPNVILKPIGELEYCQYVPETIEEPMTRYSSKIQSNHVTIPSRVQSQDNALTCDISGSKSTKDHRTLQLPVPDNVFNSSTLYNQTTNHLNDSSSELSLEYMACSPWQFQYYIHYIGYNRRYDRWAYLSELLPSFIHPVTRQMNQKSIARHYISALHSMNHPAWKQSWISNIGTVGQQFDHVNFSDSSSNLSIYNNGHTIDESPTITDACYVGALFALRILLSCIYNGEEAVINTPSNSVISNSGVSNSNSMVNTEFENESFVKWCNEYFSISSDLTLGDIHLEHEYEHYRLARLWWIQIIFSYMQLDILDNHAIAQATTKKKRKTGSSASDVSTLIWSECFNPIILNALQGKYGISEHDLNSNDLSFHEKWKLFQNKYSSDFPNKLSIQQPQYRAQKTKELSLVLNDTSKRYQLTHDKNDCIQKSLTIGSQKLQYLSGTESDSCGSRQFINKKFNATSFIPSFSDAFKLLMTQTILSAITKACTVIYDTTIDAIAPTCSNNNFNDRLHLITTLNFTRNCTGIDCYDDLDSDAGEHEGMDQTSIEAHETTTKIRTIQSIQINDYIIPTWYYSPFPLNCHPADCLFICGGCLEYFRYEVELRHHERLCSQFTPPGDEIYRDGKLSFFEVDGEIEWKYCENLCFISKLFLDHKTLQYSVTPFLFYILIEWDDTSCGMNPSIPFSKHTNLIPARNNQLVGYFSKEKCSSIGYNLACILTLPQHQRKGYGKYFMHFSYSLSKIEQTVGTPERPLSDLGRVSYTQYWKLILSEFLLSPADCPPACSCLFAEVASTPSSGLCRSGCPVLYQRHHQMLPMDDQEIDELPSNRCLGELELSIDDVSHFTSMKREDIVTTLKLMGILRIEPETNDHVILFDKDALITIQKSCGRPPPPIVPENFVWSPICTTTNATFPDALSTCSTDLYSHETDEKKKIRRFYLPHFHPCPHQQCFETS